MKFCQCKKKFLANWFHKTVVHHCKRWMHLKEVELKTIKVKSHEAFYSLADPDNLLGSRQGDGAVSISAR